MAQQAALLNRRPEPPTTDPASPAPNLGAYPVVVAGATLLAVLLLLTGSVAGAFVAGLVAASAGLAWYFHLLATRQEQDD
jgi:hypothetical protein